MRIGRKVLFDPFRHMSTYGMGEISGPVVGTVVYIHEDHGWFAVEYRGIRTCYHFDEVGKYITLI